jgi:hypothetical protein
VPCHARLTQVELCVEDLHAKRNLAVAERPEEDLLGVADLDVVGPLRPGYPLRGPLCPVGPPVQPSWTAIRYIPHPFFGMPIKKQPLRNTTLGLGMGWRWLEPFGSVVFNVQQRKDAAGKLKNHPVYKGAWGLKISVSDVAKALKNSTTKAKDTSSSTAKNTGS